MIHLLFQVFKFIYLCRLAEMGLATQAFHYCEVIAKSVLTQPGAYSPVLISQLTQVGSSGAFLLASCQRWEGTGFILLGLGVVKWYLTKRYPESTLDTSVLLGGCFGLCIINSHYLAYSS